MFDRDNPQQADHFARHKAAMQRADARTIPNAISDLGLEAGSWITIKVQVGYPGSRVTDLAVCGELVKVRNETLAEAIITKGEG